jgi:hypothetical protein
VYEACGTRDGVGVGVELRSVVVAMSVALSSFVSERGVMVRRREERFPSVRRCG